VTKKVVGIAFVPAVAVRSGMVSNCDDDYNEILRYNMMIFKRTEIPIGATRWYNQYRDKLLIFWKRLANLEELESLQN
jgi:hypothetical protein